MRSFANFIYFGNIYNAVPMGNAHVKGAYDRIFRPFVKIVEEDCGTNLGMSSAVNENVIGRLELNNSDLPIASGAGNRYQYLLQNSISTIQARVVSSCTSTGGICRKCLWGSYEHIDANWATDRLLLDNPANYPLLSTVPVVGTNFRFDFTSDPTPFLSHLARTYSGSVLGMKTYLNDSLPLKESIFQDSLKDQVVSTFYRAVSDSGAVSAIDLEYASGLNDNLEKVLFLLAQYSLGFYING